MSGHLQRLSGCLYLVIPKCGSMSIRRSEIAVGGLSSYGSTQQRVVTFIRDPRDRFRSAVAEAMERRHLPTRRPRADMRLLEAVDQLLPRRPAAALTKLLERLVEGPIDAHLWPYHYHFCTPDAVPRSRLEVYALKDVKQVLTRICGRCSLGPPHAAVGRKLQVKDWVRQGLGDARVQALFDEVYGADAQLWSIVRRRPLLLVPDEDYYTQIGY